MALIDRLKPDADDDKISSHVFSAVVYLWNRGKITRAEVISKLGLLTADEVQLDALDSTYQALPPPHQIAHHGLIESCVIALEEGMITPQEMETILGM